MPEAGYDEVLYRGQAFPQTHPDRLALLAALHGLEAADPDTCRVLELGCGDGMNLVGMAAASPEMRVVGIDAAAAPLERGRAVTEELGLGARVRLEAGDVRDLGDLGEFDYVIAHGLWSWVGDEVREAVLAAMEGALAPAGVAFVSYVALPGGNLRLLGRDVARLGGEPAGARAVLAALGRQLAGRTDPYAVALANEAARMLGRPDWALAHDELGDAYAPSWFGEVARAAGRYGLQPLCEADPAELRDGWLPAPAAAEIDALAAGDALRREELADALIGRAFRQTLLVSEAACPERLSPQGAERLFEGPGRTPVTDGPAAIAAFRAGQVDLHAARPRHAAEPGERPLAWPLARLMAAQGPDVISLRHEALSLDDAFARALVVALNGTRDRGAIVEAVASDLETAGAVPQTGEALRARVRDGLESSLATLAGLALLAR
jgi:SAM-dependent methyltransferase